MYEEDHGLAENGSTRRVDIIFIKNSIRKILDPTIRFEIDKNQPIKTNEEKVKHYESPYKFYQTKYNLQQIEIFGLNDWRNRKNIQIYK